MNGEGCLIHMTSHGSKGQGFYFSRAGIMSPKYLASAVDHACGTRPTVILISACYSGVFVPTLAAPNRLVLTAARPDRSSFGCGEADKYPYFDECFLASMPDAKTFPTLAGAVQGCVASREVKEGMKPPSEPQLFIGGALKPLLPLYPLAGDPARQN